LHYDKALCKIQGCSFIEEQAVCKGIILNKDNAFFSLAITFVHQ